MFYILFCNLLRLYSCSESQYFLAPAGAFCLISVGWWFEGDRLLETGDIHLVLSHPVIFMMAASLGIGVQLLTAAVIQGPGAVTLKVLSQIRNAALVLVGVVLFEEHVSGIQALGYLVSLIAFGFYSYLNVASSENGDKTKAKTSP
jgi:multidrug transporter EmrE-like cation transporter